jgi:hypothetical protein
MTSPHQLINQTSGEVEYFTPIEIIEAATDCIGFIDLDPASCEEANKIVGARKIFTKKDDGLSRPWKSITLWMNHPFGKGEMRCPIPHSRCKKQMCLPPDEDHPNRRGYHIDYDIPGNSDWIDKLIREWGAESFDQACCITYATTSEDWFRPLLAFPQCFLHGRTNYRLPNGDVMQGNTKGSVVTYLGYNQRDFAKAFSKLGTVKVAWSEYL